MGAIGRVVVGFVVAAALLAPAGTVAAASVDEECPEPPLTVTDLHDLYLGGGPLRERYAMAVTQINEKGLDCYGSRALALWAFVAPPGGIGGTQAYRIEPRWLGDHDLFVWDAADLDEGGLHRGGPFLTVAVPPEFAGVTDRYDGRWVRLTGRFDHPAAASCVANGVEGETPSPADTFEICRSFFVLTGIEALPSAPATDTSLGPSPRRAPTGWLAVVLGGVAGWLVAAVARGPAGRRRQGHRSGRLA